MSQRGGILGNLFPRRLFAVICLLGGGLLGAWTPLSAQQKRYRPLPDYGQLGQPDQAEGKRVLAEFRDRGLPTNYYLEFQLTVLPRRGPERVIDGRWWCGQTEKGPISRLVLVPAGEGAGSKGPEQRWLVQGGPQPSVWYWSAEQPDRVVMQPFTQLFAPLAGTDLSAFDLSMPYLFWTDFVFEGVRKVRGRPAHSFLLYPPADVAERQPTLTGVRVSLDTQFNALVDAAHIGEQGKVLKQMSLLDVKKVDERWIPKNIDFRNEVSRDKTRFGVTSAALDVEFANTLFSPAYLSEAVAAPTAGLKRVTP